MFGHKVSIRGSSFEVVRGLDNFDVPRVQRSFFWISCPIGISGPFALPNPNPYK